MAVIAGYSALQTAISDYLARSDLTSWLPNFTQNWEERFYREPENRGPWMEQTFNVTVASNVAAIPTPNTYLGTRIAYISGQRSPPLKPLSLEQLYARYPRAGGTGTPVYLARNGSNFEFGPIAGNGAVLVGTYYAKPTLMRSFPSDAAAHFLIVNAPDLCLYGSLLEAEPFIKNDSRLPTWGNLYSVALEAYRGRMRAENSGWDSPATVAV